MAIISEGELLLTGEPANVIDELRGKIWRREIDKGDLDRFQEEYRVISKRLIGGRTVIHVFSAGQPGSGFESVAADLKDVYFSTLKRVA